MSPFYNQQKKITTVDVSALPNEISKSTRNNVTELKMKTALQLQLGVLKALPLIIGEKMSAMIKEDLNSSTSKPKLIDIHRITQ